MTISSPAFKSVYKVTLPNIKEAKNEQEKGAYTDTAVNTVVMASNMSSGEPKVDKSTGSVYFKINDANDAKFEAGFNQILEMCNNSFNIDMAKKAYIQKVSEEEYNQAQSL